MVDQLQMENSLVVVDPIYERRQLTRNVSVPSRYLQRSIQTSLLGQLKSNIEGKCGMEGYVAKNSITILNHTMGRISTMNDKAEYRVTFQVDICMPHPGQIFRAPISFRSKIGVHCELDPMKILMPRDLHLGNTEYESLGEGDEIEIEVVGSQFQQQDTHIYVLGKFLKRTAVSKSLPGAPIEQEVLNIDMPENVAPQEEATAPPSGDNVVKMISVAPSAMQADGAPARRRRRLVKPTTNDGVLQINVGGTNPT